MPRFCGKKRLTHVFVLVFVQTARFQKRAPQPEACAQQVSNTKHCRLFGGSLSVEYFPANRSNFFGLLHIANEYARTHRTDRRVDIVVSFVDFKF
jgi:hypothetical protein